LLNPLPKLNIFYQLLQQAI